MDQRTRQKKLSLRQEKKANQELGSKMMPASGALLHGGGDGRLPGKIRLECKYTEADKYILKLDDLIKLRTQAVKGGLEEPIFQVEFKGTTKGKYAIVLAKDGNFKSSEGITVVQQVKQYPLHADILAKLSGGQADPLIRITFVNPPLAGFTTITYAIYEWNKFLKGRDDNRADSLGS